LVLRRGSNIITNATGTATGGNITIDTGVIAALSDSDISANAQEARGGGSESTLKASLAQNSVIKIPQKVTSQPLLLWGLSSAAPWKSTRRMLTPVAGYRLASRAN